MNRALSLCHQEITQLIQRFPEGIYIDATLGKGNDTAYILSHSSFMGKVFGFDIQAAAIQASLQKLKDHDTDRFDLFLHGHQDIDICLPLEEYPSFTGAVFNLGYLPGGDHEIITRADSTYEALLQISRRLIIGGRIILVLYTGHPGGAEEAQSLLKEIAKWPQETFCISHNQWINQINTPPSLLLIEKIK